MFSIEPDVLLIDESFELFPPSLEAGNIISSLKFEDGISLLLVHFLVTLF